MKDDSRQSEDEQYIPEPNTAEAEQLIDEKLNRQAIGGDADSAKLLAERRLERDIKKARQEMFGI
jgi:hypothetical protein